MTIQSLLRPVRYRLMWRSHRARLDGLAEAHPLRYLFLEVTRRCNLACLYCGSDCTGRARDGEMTSAEWVEALRQIAADFPRRPMVAVTGGEPLLKEGILDIFRELQRLGYPYGMVTNGARMTPEMARDVVAAGIGSISVSMDAPPAINDELRGRGAAAGVERAVAALREAGFTGKLEVISTLTRPALPHLEEMRRHLASLRIPLWRVAPVMPIGRARGRDDLVPTPADIRGLLEWVRAARNDPRLPRPEFGEEGYVGARFEGFVRPYLAGCRAGITVAGIKCDGRIGACPELSDAFDQGDIRRERFKDVWEGRYQSLRDRAWARKGACDDCGRWPECHGGAMHLYDRPGGEFARCLYLQCKECEGGAG